MSPRRKASKPAEVTVVPAARTEDKTPALVLELAAKVGGQPWSWLVAEDHVCIVLQDGRKVRFERELE